MANFKNMVSIKILVVSSRNVVKSHDVQSRNIVSIKKCVQYQNTDILLKFFSAVSVI